MESWKELLYKLQDLSEDNKRIFAIAASCVVMSGVVFVWLTWFSTLGDLRSNPETATAGVNSSGFSFWQSVEAVAMSLFENVKNILLSVVNWAGNYFGSGEYMIKPKN